MPEQEETDARARTFTMPDETAWLGSGPGNFRGSHHAGGAVAAGGAPPAEVAAMQPKGVVYVVDDDQGARDSLAMLLKVSGYEVVTFADPLRFLDGLPHLAPGCVLLDLRMPTMPGEEVLRRMAPRRDELPAIILTGHGDVPLAVECIKGGARDFIEKPYERGHMLASVADGLLSIPRPGGEGNPARSLVDSLPPRQRQVLERVVAGYPNKVIAGQLNLSPRTVEIHRSRMMERLGVRNLSQTIQLAMQAGIVPTEAVAAGRRD